MSSNTEKILGLLRYFPRFNELNVPRGPYLKPEKYKTFVRGHLGQHGRRFQGHKGQRQRQRYQPVGHEGGRFPFYLKIPVERYYKDIFIRRQYPPFSMFKLQLLIDMGKIDPSHPIDLATLCNTNHYRLKMGENNHGVHLTDEGIDVFKAKVNIEVQHATEQVIAAVEKNGGVITTAYFDIESVTALNNPLKYFQKGNPIPKRRLPPPDAIDYYTNPKFRGYLADPDKIAEERFILSQKYGYILPDITKDPSFNMLTLKKDPRQVFYGLEPGWVINLKDRQILKPVDDLLQEYYKS